jgi:hypothetical protein
MLGPFQEIFERDRYTLKCTWMANVINISGCIKATYDQYGPLGIKSRDFSKMITKISTGTSSNSVLSARQDPSIIMAICQYFPTYLNNKDVEKIIKCFGVGKKTYPQECVDAIVGTGYVFTESQIKDLCSLGYTMLKLLKSMTYNEFISQFNAIDFWTTFEEGLSADYEIIPELINNKINTLKEICDRFKIKLEPTFVNTIVGKFKKVKDRTNCMNMVLNVHIIAEKLGMVFDINTFKGLTENNITFYSLDHSDKNDEYNREKLLKIIQYYGKPIDREFILNNLNPKIFSGFLHPMITDYEPIEDIFFIIFESDMLELSDYIKHMLKYNYLLYDDFLLFIIFIKNTFDIPSIVGIFKDYLKKK